MSPVTRHNVKISGTGSRAVLFAHGFGCDQNMWRFVAPAFQDQYKVVTFDHVGHGKAEATGFDHSKYASLNGYAEDVLSICDALELEEAIFVGHSVSAMIGVLASVRRPECFSSLVLVGPSPRYINDEGYIGGFQKADIEGLLDSLDSNYLGWSSSIAPVIMANSDRPELGEELANSFCRTDPVIAKHFARVTFLSDNRMDLSKVTVATLVLQCSQDVIAPESVGLYTHGHIPNSEFVLMKATGHCPNLSAPEETIAAIKTFLKKLSSPKTIAC